MKIAIVHDVLINKGGAERIALLFHKIFPNAPIYTAAYFPDKTYPEFRNADIRLTMKPWKLFNEKIVKLAFPFLFLSMKNCTLKDYDIILSSSTFCAKHISYENALHFCYCHTPFRLAWYPDTYLNQTNRYYFPFIKAISFILRKIDLSANKNIDLFITNCEGVKKKIMDIYNRASEVLNPPINISQYYISEDSGKYYLLVSRLEPYKKADIVVRAFNSLSKKLIVVGEGSRKAYLKNIAKSNITFYENLSDAELAELYSKCRALIFPQREDYGITPLECIASGRPVIAYSEGGITETMVSFQETNDAAVSTAYFFDQQSAESIIEAVSNFEELSFSPAFIREYAKRFDEESFKAGLLTLVHRHMSISA